MTFACAHRGDSSRFRENTLEAIKSAIDLKAEIIEIDVKLSKSGEVVVLHDHTLERMWGVSSPVDQLTWEEISQLGTEALRIPLLIDVLKLFENTDSVLMIDLDSIEVANPSFEIVKDSNATIYWCGHLDAMRKIRTLSALAHIWQPWNNTATPTENDILELKPLFINSHYSFMDRDKVRAIHNLGCRVAVWTIDDQATMRWALSIGIDSVTSNQLALLQETLVAGPATPANAVDLDQAMTIARNLGAWAIEVARSVDPGKIVTKQNPADLVTEIDLLIEKHVREVITANFPGHNFVGEEMGGSYKSEVPSWYLDPIDGTTNFANRMPWSSFSLALAIDRVPLVAVVIDPWRRDLFEAAAGKGAKLNGKAIMVEQIRNLQNPLAGRIVSTELAAYQAWPGMLELLDQLAQNFCTMRIMGSGTLTLTGVAINRGVGAVIGEFSPIDHLAANLIVHEAGGVVMDEAGNINLFPESGGIMTATPAAAAALHSIWKKAISNHQSI